MNTPKVILLAEEYCRNRPKFSGYSIEEADAFVAGYKAAQQWISVKDNLPEIRTPVLTCDEYTKEIFVAWRDPCDEFLGMYDWVKGDRLLGQVTHWMALPEAPKEEK